MSDVLKMDIFFVVTTIAVVILTVLFSIAAFYLIHFLKTLDRISEEIEEEARQLRLDMKDMREKAKEEGFKFTHIVNFFTKTHKRIKKKAK